MDFQIREPILVIGTGGAGSRLATMAAKAAGADCLLISSDSADLGGSKSVQISTKGVINPSVRLVRASAYEAAGQIESAMRGYSTVIMMSNLAGKTGAAVAPVVSGMCKKAGTGLVSFAIMPFGYEKNRLFDSGIALKRIRADSGCTVVLDNDSMLESNPDLSPKECYGIADSAIMHVVCSLGSSEMSGTSILTAGRQRQDIEESLRDSLKMLYGNAPPGSTRRSMLYVVGGGVSTGMIDSVSKITSGMLGDGGSHVDSASEESGIVMLSSVQGMTKFDGYDPLGAIPQEDTLDWSAPECSIDCGLELYQME
ncbi:MAG: cell division protein FtsZ [Nitrosopumilus sp. H8]|nr:MAG: cell division protein FtsZ [Nitrosopumilus sp. H13]RNJ80022.1 MAG: cell division protein FtsZ [Nitrosopumilus sp. H8]